MTAEPRDWMVYDGARRDPWGTSQGDFGPMTENDAKKFVADGAECKVPRHYFALRTTRRGGSNEAGEQRG